MTPRRVIRVTGSLENYPVPGLKDSPHVVVLHQRHNYQPQSALERKAFTAIERLR